MDGVLHRAYGVTFRGLPPVAELACLGAVDGGLDDPFVTVTIGRPGPPPPLCPLGPDGSVRRLVDGRVLALDRARRTAVFYGPPLSADAIAHPYLAPVATTFSRWAGRESFHAGAFVLGGRAWSVLGARTAGKSTLLAALVMHGVDVLCDDIVVTDGAVVFRAPRCIDLREALPSGRLRLNPARGGTRLRLPLADGPDQVPLGGWLFLDWARDLQVRQVAAGELLGRLAACRGGRTLTSDPAVLLSLATVPAYDLGRPRDWAELDATIDLIRATVDAAGPPTARHGRWTHPLSAGAGEPSARVPA